MALWALGLAAGAAGSYFGSKKKSEGIKTFQTEDKIKTAVSSPLSAYLKRKMGEIDSTESGLDRYPGQLYSDLDQDTKNRYTEFMSTSPKDWFKENVTDPTMESWREDIKPIISEGWAGSLRGSGHYGDVEESASATTKELATIGGQMEVDIFGQQIQTGVAMKQLRDLDLLKDYEDWFKSLEENDPTLATALQFLKGPTGIDTGAYYDPGKSPWYADVLKGAGCMMSAYAMKPGTGNTTTGNTTTGMQIKGFK